MEGGLELESWERRLLAAEFLDCRPVWYSSNYVYLARMCAQDQVFAAIYKPRRGETPLWDFPEGTLYRREAAAYQLSLLLGWSLIPPTVVREGPAGIGSLQLYIEHDPEAHYFVQRERPELWPQLQRLCLFDAIANNADRKGGHCLLDASEHVWGIDNGLCFNEHYKLRTVIWDWAGETIPGDLLDDVAALLEALERPTDTSAALRALISPHEVEMVCSRARQLLRRGTFPTPGQARHYPWPLI